MAGPYRLEALVGQGATGSVYLGSHPLIGSQVAIKVLHADVLRLPGMGERFVREARASNMVDSPHVLHIRDFGKLEDGRDYAVMDFLRGLPLDSLIEAEGALELGRAIDMMVQVASGLAAAHRAGVLHRDVKPSNLFVTEGPGGDHVFILDFGIAKLLEAPACSQTQTVEGWLVGTPGYCAPEQALHDPVGPAADVYAFATVAYEMLTGRPLFDAPSIVELLADKVRAGRVDLSNLPPETPDTLVDLLDRMLAREPAVRPSMQEVEGCLRCLLEESPRNGSRPSLVHRPSSSSRPSLAPTQLGLGPSTPSVPPAGPTPLSFPPVEAVGTRARGRPGAVILTTALLVVVAVVAFATLRSPADEGRSSAARSTTVEASAGATPFTSAAASGTSEAPASSKAPVAATGSTSARAAPAVPLPRAPKNAGWRPKKSGAKSRGTERKPSPPPPGLVDPFAEK